MSFSSEQIQDLSEVIQRWAHGEGLSVSMLASDIAGGLVVSASLLPIHGYATLYERYADKLGLDKDACGKTFTIESGEKFQVLGLDPVGIEKKVVVQINGHRKHLSVDQYREFLVQQSTQPRITSEG